MGAVSRNISSYNSGLLKAKRRYSSPNSTSRFSGLGSKATLSKVLENSIKDDKTIFYGYFNEKELLSISGLFLDIEDLKYELETLNIQTNYCAEIGASMTLKSARGKKCMLNINKKLIEVANDKGLKYIIATAHPDNIAGNISLRNLNMKFIKEFSRQSFPRNLYIKYL